KHHEEYPDIYIDNTEDPVSFYMRECQGKLFSRKRYLARFIKYHAAKIFWFRGEDLLRKLLTRHGDDQPLVLLDSAGGLGFLEFNIVHEMMSKKMYWLLLDEIHHLKHFRSFEKIKADPSFCLMGHDESHGWAFARHVPPGR
ncbi:MAG: hypothetical protein NC930_00275, partial [Candidatus Omnitrophica bacterium]|nr:hypothetical protein [Candidatus Omnitrophota bacterium]